MQFPPTVSYTVCSFPPNSFIHGMQFTPWQFHSRYAVYPLAVSFTLCTLPPDSFIHGMQFTPWQFHLRYAVSPDSFIYGMQFAPWQFHSRYAVSSLAVSFTVCSFPPDSFVHGMQFLPWQFNSRYAVSPLAIWIKNTWWTTVLYIYCILDTLTWVRWTRFWILLLIRSFLS